MILSKMVGASLSARLHADSAKHAQVMENGECIPAYVYDYDQFQAYGAAALAAASSEAILAVDRLYLHPTGLQGTELVVLNQLRTERQANISSAEVPRLCWGWSFCVCALCMFCAGAVHPARMRVDRESPNNMLVVASVQMVWQDALFMCELSTSSPGLLELTDF